MEKNPGHPVTLQLLDITVQEIVNSRDKLEIDRLAELLTPEERENSERLKQMSDEELRRLADETQNAHDREVLAEILWCRTKSGGSA